MPKYSEKSKGKLETCKNPLQRVFNIVIRAIDITILCGIRPDEEQFKAFAEGRSKLDGVKDKSKHQADHTKLSSATDAAPWPIDWDVSRRSVLKRWYYMGGFVMGVAFALGIKLRWGGDWDRDADFDDQNFNDLPHYELVEKNTQEEDLEEEVIEEEEEDD